MSIEEVESGLKIGRRQIGQFGSWRGRSQPMQPFIIAVTCNVVIKAKNYHVALIKQCHIMIVIEQDRMIRPRWQTQNILPVKGCRIAQSQQTKHRRRNVHLADVGRANLGCQFCRRIKQQRNSIMLNGHLARP